MKHLLLTISLVSFVAFWSCSSSDDNNNLTQEESTELDFTDYDQVYALMQGDWKSESGSVLLSIKGDNYTITDLDLDEVLMSGEFVLEPATAIYNVVIHFYEDGLPSGDWIVSGYDNGVAQTDKGKYIKQ